MFKSKKHFDKHKLNLKIKLLVKVFIKLNDHRSNQVNLS